MCRRLPWRSALCTGLEGHCLPLQCGTCGSFRSREILLDSTSEGRPRYLGGVRLVPEASGTLVLGPLGVSIPLRCCGAVLGAVRGASPCCRSARSRLVSGRVEVPGGSGARRAGLVVSGSPGRPGDSPGPACPGLLGSVPGVPGVPGLLGPGPMLPRPPGLPGAPAPLPGAPPPAWAKARLEARQSTGSDITTVLATVRTIGSLPCSKGVLGACVPLERPIGPWQHVFPSPEQIVPEAQWQVAVWSVHRGAANQTRPRNFCYFGYRLLGCDAMIT